MQTEEAGEKNNAELENVASDEDAAPLDDMEDGPLEDMEDGAGVSSKKSNQ